ncbi:Gfo/Idh/MocA family oxidoreductase [Verrucomicrobiaceae bacterium N1E253]|uniref:Gfo/Idh/MocA family oxidoreductase n=1 Tax=Oceaniferula marina TaxID=2748318 RepID=A0A851GL89_9BACT|nr:Gfo/Idh/MocA family oxidoreductase [Oceaniferula marina]NWK54924.1 Gfo/Idh/MocA family oxidoreductase [Oceaniferula marina]
MKTQQSSQSRRRFLKNATAAAAITGFPSILTSKTKAAAASAKQPLRVVQVGCGRIAKGMDIPGILRHPKLARIVGVCDVDSQRTEWAKQQVEKSYKKSLGSVPEITMSGDYKELIKRDDVDAVVISTPDHWHAQPVIEAALAGKHIFVQKPLTMTIAEGRLASDIVRANKRILQIGSQQRSTEQFHRACQLVRNGKIGKVRRIQIGLPIDPAGGNGKVVPVPDNLDYEQWLGCTPNVPYAVDRVHMQGGFRTRPGWLRQNQFTCGMITGWGSHHLDIAHWAMDTELTGPIAVDASAKWPGEDSFWDVHGEYNVKLKYANGVDMEVSHKFTNGLRIEGDDGWIWVSRGSYSATKSDPTSGKKSKAFDASDKSWVNSDLSKDDVQLHRSPKWDHHLDWLQAVNEGKDAVTNVETGHRSCSACMVSWIGMKLGRPLKWDPVKERFDDAEANTMLARAERGPYGVKQYANKLK